MAPVILGLSSPPPPAPTSVTFIKRVAASNDSSSLYTPSNYWGGPDQEPYYWQDRAGGLIYQNFRFTNVTVPQNARIISANLILTSVDTFPAKDFKWNDIGAEQVANASVLTSGSNFASRVLNTGLRRRWKYPSTTVNTAFTSPDLTGVVQQIVNNASWVSGNAIQFFGVTDISSASTTWSADAQVVSFGSSGGDTARMPRLEITYLPSAAPDVTISTFLPGADSDNSMSKPNYPSGDAPLVDYLDVISTDNANPVTTHFRFPNVTVPKGAEVVAASFSTVVRWYDSSPPGSYVSNLAYADFSVRQVDNSATPSTHAELLGYATSATVKERQYKYPDFNVGSNMRTPELDLTTQVQTLVNRAGWASGNALAVMGYTSTSVPANHGLGVIPRNAAPGDSAKWPRLTIAWKA